MDIAPLTLCVGAEITGIDLCQPLSEADSTSVHQALMDYGVLFFRDQPVTPDQQADFGRLFGRVPEVPDSMFRVHPDNACVSVLENDADRPPTVNTWHSDYSFAAMPDFASILRSIVVPEAGGDTIWVNMATAYQALPDHMKNMLEGLTATHDYMYLYERPFKKYLWEGERYHNMEAARLEHPPVSHPVVRTHPETGEKVLFINESFTRHIDGMSDNESRSILGYLINHITLPEFQVRFRWTPDTVAMWDNRATVHYAVADYHPAHRLMHRVTVLKDEVPV
jgi:taurine dioxygenase